jgi:hypothetical protein
MAKKIKKYKVGLESETYAISIVESPAIEETLVALEEQKEIKVQLANEEKHMIYSAVLVPDKPIYRRNEDGDEFYVEFTKESIEHMSQQFFKEYKQNEVTLDHETTASDVTVVESWIKADMFKDKSVALGLNESLPTGTWFCGMKVNQIDVWDRVKSGELRGFSVESLIRLEEFSKEEDKNNDIMNIDEMSFWTKMKEVLKEAFTSSSMVKDEDIEPTNIDLEAETQTETVVEAPVVEEPSEPKVEEPVVEEPKEPEVVEEPKQEEAPKVEEQPKTDPHLEELINSLKEEVEALKRLNGGLQTKIKNLEKEPSTQPISTNARPTNASGVGNPNYQAWRKQLEAMMIG